MTEAQLEMALLAADLMEGRGHVEAAAVIRQLVADARDSLPDAPEPEPEPEREPSRAEVLEALKAKAERERQGAETRNQ